MFVLISVDRGRSQPAPTARLIPAGRQLRLMAPPALVLLEFLQSPVLPSASLWGDGERTTMPHSMGDATIPGRRSNSLAVSHGLAESASISPQRSAMQSC